MNSGVELRVYLPIPDLGRQFAAYLGTPLRARGYPPIEGDHALIVEVAPALAIERVTDLALRSVPEIEPGILYVERQFGVLEVHHRDQALVDRAGAAILDGIGAKAADALRPRILYADVIEDITDQHAVIINRNREASMVLPGETLLVYAVVPALPDPWNNAPAKINSFANLVVTVPVDALAADVAAATVTSRGATWSSPEYS